MHFTILTEEEFKNFTDKNSTKNFFQSIPMYKRQKNLNEEVYLVGVKNDNEEVIAASLLTKTSTFLKHKTFEAFKGFILNYDNLELLKFFVNEVKKFIKERNGCRLTIDPYLPLVHRDIDGNEVLGEETNRELAQYLEKIGFKYIGEGAQVKWMFVLDIDGATSEELFSNFKQNTRNLINRTINKYCLNVRELSYDELAEFKKITSETCERKSFSDRSLEYYQQMFKYFKEDIKVIMTELNCDLYLNSLKSEALSYEKIIEKSKDKKKKEAEFQLENINNKIKKVLELKSKKGNIIPLSAAMFMLYGDEVIYLFSGSYEEYMEFYGQYRIQWEMIKYAAQHKYRRYNFYGIKDFKNKDSEGYGIYEFKKGFNGYVEELLGLYEVGFGFTYKLYKLLKKLK